MSEMVEDEEESGIVDAGSGEAQSHTASPASCIPNPESSANEFPRETFLGLLRSGLWPGAAVAYLGVTREAWREARARDAKLSADTAKAVAAFEMIHVRNLHAKIQEANDWRGSAWWLAQRFPKRYGGGRQAHEAEKAVDEVLTVLDRALRTEFSAPAELGRLANVFGKLREERVRGSERPSESLKD